MARALLCLPTIASTGSKKMNSRIPPRLNPLRLARSNHVRLSRSISSSATSSSTVLRGRDHWGPQACDPWPGSTKNPGAETTNKGGQWGKFVAKPWARPWRLPTGPTGNRSGPTRKLGHVDVDNK